MNRKELIEYLTAVCDGETAKYACEETIRKLRGKKDGLVYPQKESNPEKKAYPKRWAVSVDNISRPGMRYRPKEPDLKKIREITQRPNKSIEGIIVTYIMAVIVLSIIWGEFGAIPLGSAIVLTWLLRDWVTEWISNYYFNKEVKAKYEAALAKYQQDIKEYDQWRREFDHQMEEYNRQCDAEYRRQCTAIDEEYQQQCAIIDANHGRNCDIVDTKRTSLENVIAEYQAALIDIQKNLTSLYERNIIFEDFRNIVAVHQLRRYMEMGVCDTLEGSTGAYSLYLQDLRTEKICGTIDNLKRAMLYAVGTLAQQQERLIREVQAVNSNLESLEYAIDSGFSNISDRIDGISRILPVLSDNISGGIAANAAQLNSIERAISESANRSYVVEHYDSMCRYIGSSKV